MKNLKFHIVKRVTMRRLLKATRIVGKVQFTHFSIKNFVYREIPCFPVFFRAYEILWIFSVFRTVKNLDFIKLILFIDSYLLWSFGNDLNMFMAISIGVEGLSKLLLALPLTPLTLTRSRNLPKIQMPFSCIHLVLTWKSLLVDHFCNEFGLQKVQSVSGAGGFG